MSCCRTCGGGWKVFRSTRGEVPSPSIPETLARAKQRREGVETKPCAEYRCDDPDDYGYRSCQTCGWAEPEHIIDQLVACVEAGQAQLGEARQAATELLEAVGIAKAEVARLRENRDSYEALEAVIRTILDDVIGANNDPLWIVRREFIDQARAALTPKEPAPQVRPLTMREDGCCCQEHHVNHGRCLQCPTHGLPAPAREDRDE